MFKELGILILLLQNLSWRERLVREREKGVTGKLEEMISFYIGRIGNDEFDLYYAGCKSGSELAMGLWAMASQIRTSVFVFVFRAKYIFCHSSLIIFFFFFLFSFKFVL